MAIFAANFLYLQTYFWGGGTVQLCRTAGVFLEKEGGIQVFHFCILFLNVSCIIVQSFTDVSSSSITRQPRRGGAMSTAKMLHGIMSTATNVA